MAYFPLLTIILETTSRFKLLYTTQNQATLALALVIGLGLFGFKDRLGRKLANWGKYEASKIADHAYQGVFSYRQNWRKYNTFCQNRIFNVCFFGTKMPIYSVQDCLENQKKPICGKTRPKPYFSMFIFIRKLSLPSFGPRTVALYQFFWP